MMDIFLVLLHVLGLHLQCGIAQQYSSTALSITTKCGEYVTRIRDQKTISYPAMGNYRANQGCSWLIDRDGWYKLQFERFYTEEIWDPVFIKEVDADRMTYSGRKDGMVLYLHGPSTISFRSDNYKGFRELSANIIPLESLPMYKEVGCYKDKRTRAIRGKKTVYKNKPSSEVLDLCFRRAASEGNSHFGISNKHDCYTSGSASKTYNRYGGSNRCLNGIGQRGSALAVYEIFTSVIKYEYAFNEYQAHSYLDAVVECVKWGGALATVANKLEDQSLQKQLKNRNINQAWIGLNRIAHEDPLEDPYVWVNPVFPPYTKVNLINSVSWSFAHNCFTLKKDGKWSQGKCEEQLPYICQKPKTKKTSESVCWRLISPGCTRGQNLGRAYRGIKLEQCKALCVSHPGCKAIEFGVPHGGTRTNYKPGDCILNSGTDSRRCDGKRYNLDLYIKIQCL